MSGSFSQRNAPKDIRTKAYPVHAKDTSGLLTRVEPFLTAEKLRRRFLKGIPLDLPDGSSFTDDDLKDKIMLAMNEAEMLIGQVIERTRFEDKLAFDRNLYKQFVHVQTLKSPILSVEEFAIYSANGENLFTIPTEWVETGNFHKGQINIVPFLASYSGNLVTGTVSNAGIAFLATLESVKWVPAYWQVTYVAGLCKEDGTVPVIVNQLIGAIAAIEILGLLGPLNPYTSVSLSQDGIGQSTAGPGPQVYITRMQQLEAQRDELIRKLKNTFNSKFILTNF